VEIDSQNAIKGPGIRSYSKKNSQHALISKYYQNYYRSSSSGVILGSSSGRVICIVFLRKTFTITLLLSTQMYIWTVDEFNNWGGGGLGG